jgi:uncharacterized protein (TIGR04255 family)
MTEGLKLAHAPIIEAVVDINCDLPPALDLAAIQDRAKQAFSGWYPRARRQMTQRHEFSAAATEAGGVAVRHLVSGLQFLSADERQIVQIRPEGYSFNRLAPYGSLDEYLPGIEWSWGRFREITRPVQIRGIGLRYINRMLLPMDGGQIDLPAYLNVTPLVPDRETLEFVGFLNQSSAVETETGNRVNITLATQPAEDERLPIIFDIEVSNPGVRSPEEWQGIREAIESLRRLKNRVFERTLTQRCLNLFQQP